MPDFTPLNNWPIAVDTDVVKQFPTTVDEPFKTDLDYKVNGSYVRDIVFNPVKFTGLGLGLWQGTLTTAPTGHTPPLDLSGGQFTGNILWASILRMGSDNGIMCGVTNGGITTVQFCLWDSSGVVLGNQTIANCWILFLGGGLPAAP